MSDFDNMVRARNDPDFPFCRRTDVDRPLVEVAAGELFDIFSPVFESYGIYGNGPTWDGLVTQALEKVNPKLLAGVDFNSEADICVMEMSTEEGARRMIDALKGIFNNEASLREFLDTVDTSVLDG